MHTSTRTLLSGRRTLRLPPRHSTASLQSSQLLACKMSTKPPATTTQPSTQRSRLPVHVQHSTSTSSIPLATSTLIEAFESDPVTAYMLNHLPRSSRLPALQKLFLLSSNAAVKAGGELWSASTTSPSSSTPDFQAAATIFPPEKSLDDLGLASLPGLLLGGGLAPALCSIGPNRFVSRMNAYGAATTPSKKATFPDGEMFFYVQLIGAGSRHRGRGLAPALIRKLQERAREERKPIYLEASNEGARRVYEKLGFEEVGEMIWLGKGECDVQGEVAAGEAAKGVPMWPMVWRPEGKST
jgi:GNAT superfamily N-acetyltransferase